MGRQGFQSIAMTIMIMTIIIWGANMDGCGPGAEALLELLMSEAREKIVKCYLHTYKGHL